MKKILALVLALVLALTSLTAFAAGTDGKGDTIARNGELAAFMDGNGYIYISGQSRPVNTTVAEKILSIDPYRIVFFAKENFAAGIPANRLICLTLDGFAEHIVTDDAFAACVSGDSIYYISAGDRKALVEADVDTFVSNVLYETLEPMQRVYMSNAGLVVTLVEGAGAYIQDRVTGKFVTFNGDIAAEIADYEGFEVYLTDSNSLYVQLDGLASPTLVDTSVQDWAVIGETIYYLSGSLNKLTLKSYATATNLWRIILAPSIDMEAQLTASENALFMLSKAGKVYSVDVYNNRLADFVTLPALNSYALGGGKTLDSYRIEAVSGQLNVYGIISDSNTLPTFTFVDFSSQVVEDTSSELMLLSAYAIAGESTVWDLLQPAEQFTILRRGSRGDAVSAIQKPLAELDYYDYIVDGIFGWRTEQAIRLLQADLNMEINGIADAELQRIILSGNLDAYDPYRVLERGDRGYRVQEMQERLRDLGYLADDADGIFGPRTREAVELFQNENGLKETGIADASTLRKLYSDTANSCSTYIDLQRGDTGYRVRELNRRLKKLYYLEGEVGSSYNSATVAAVKRFQEEYGLTVTGSATEKVQKALFSKKAPEYSGYITLQRGDDNERVEEMQLRLTKLNYYAGRTDGYYDKATRDAVKLFQRAVNLKVTGIADPDTLQELFSKNAPEYREPEAVTEPVIELSAYSAYDNGIYTIADSVTTDGGVTVSWFADGDMDAYDISIKDDRDTVYLSNKGLTPDQTIASIPVLSLDPDRTYTITVVAHPVDEDDASTRASIRFVRSVEEPEPDPDEIGVIGKLIVMPMNEGVTSEGGVCSIPGGTIRFSWVADGAVAGYTYSLLDEDSDPVITQESLSSTTELSLDAGALKSGVVYTLIVNAIPTNGTPADATTESISFRLAEAATPEPTEEPVITPEPVATPEPTEEPVVTEEPEITPEPELPTEEPEITPEPELPTEEPEVTPEPELPTEEPVVTPEPALVGMPQLSVEPFSAVSMEELLIDDMPVTAEVYEVYEGDLALMWPAERSGGYRVQILDAHNNLLVDQDMNSATAAISSNVMEPGEIYTLRVTAFSAKDSSVSQTAVLYFRLPVQEAPVEEDPYQEEYAEEPVEEEIYEEEIYEEEYAEEPSEEETYEEEYAEEPYEDEIYDEEYVEESYEEEPAEEVYEEEYAEEEPVEEEYVEEEPAEEDYAEEAFDEYPMDDPSAWQDPIDMDSDPMAIEVIQLRLVEWLWLEEEAYEPGELDELTIEAIIAFQAYCTEAGLELIPCFPEEPVIEPDTLWLLFNADEMEIINPNA